MRLVLAALMVALPTAASAGCGTGTGSEPVAAAPASSSASTSSDLAATPSPSTTVSGPASASASVPVAPPPSSGPSSRPGPGASTVRAYNLLAGELARFVDAAQVAEKAHPEAHPETVEEVLALVDHRFADGVRLSVFEPDGHVCLTGPEGTYLSLSESRGGDLRENLGTGPCAYDRGDVVLEIDFDVAELRVKGRVLEGRELADQVPALDAVVDVLDDAFAPARAAEGDVTTDGSDG
jgi:hypothetical protein